jgi:hypothetical protein
MDPAATGSVAAGSCHGGHRREALDCPAARNDVVAGPAPAVLDRAAAIAAARPAPG